MLGLASLTTLAAATRTLRPAYCNDAVLTDAWVFMLLEAWPAAEKGNRHVCAACTHPKTSYGN